MNAPKIQPTKLSDMEKDLIMEITSCKEFNRIRHVSFLGIIDDYYLNCSTSKCRFSRADHSFGVLFNTLKILNYSDFNNTQRLTAIATALCHDLGHSPFSHSLEKALIKIDDSLNHKKVLDELLYSCSSELNEILLDFGIQRSKVSMLSNGTSEDSLNWIFHGAFNVDTLDGITRAFKSLNIPVLYNVTLILKSIASLSSGDSSVWKSNISEFDLFWNSKSFFYDYLIESSPLGIIENDFVEKVLMNKNWTNIEDYLSTDGFFKNICYYYSDCESKFEFDKFRFSEKFSKYTISGDGQYSINSSIEIENLLDIENRYMRGFSVHN